MSFIAPRFQFLVFAVTALALPAMAANADAAPASTATASVRYADLDLRTEAGVTELEHRIARAADRVCGPADLRSLADIELRDICRAKAVTDATPRVDSVVAMAREGSRYAMNQDKGLVVRVR
jgi:UrcA family protein